MSNQQESDNKVAGAASQAAHDVAHSETQGVKNEVSFEIRERMGWFSRLKNMVGLH